MAAFLSRLPFICNYYVTLRCNAACAFCNIWQRKEIIREPSLEEIEQNIRGLKKLKFKWIDFTGGEPLLYPHIAEALSLARKNKFRTTLTTNCILYPEMAEKIRDLVSVLFFSLDSSDEQKHNSIRGAVSFKSVLDSIAAAKRLKQRFALLCTVTDDTLEDLPGIVDFAGRNRCHLYINPCFEYFGNNSLSPGNAETVLKFSREPFVSIDYGYMEFIASGGNDPDRNLCRAVSSCIVISPDNCLIAPCFHHAVEKVKIKGKLFELYRSMQDLYSAKEGRFYFCKGCVNYCYFRASLFRRYPSHTLKTYGAFARESVLRR